MEKRMASGAILIMVLMAISVFAFSNLSASQVYTREDMVRLGFTNFVCAEKNGEPVGCSPNTVTNFGLNNTRDKLMSNTVLEAWKTFYLSTGTTAPSATDIICEATVVTASGLTSANGTLAIANTGNFTSTHTWTAGATQSGIAKVCLFNGTGNAIMASALISPTVNMGANDNLTVTYYVVVS